ncbi:aldehyde dehydrogenase family protein [Amycolatopsis acidiphila]|uniref:aldehyde dehydrogenase (NAD(+)) n=1 Tax=Amycolatopsis acidiphila TaxID=715473 RepID=A0A558AM92_9PSEU|nr:aldehyde dehydrogenase family protein [Amycolatopsis acidiphila]TVT25360.1 aldehyde dehydrogenase family protein [Amycolatopsis acidiphila]UIJ62491.1 aldehyde dehydrogenase family protein [Amycolatopsis acidiphila]GHG83925.1 aldehyde dehydrogenase [Amycolatopsis acidiphila]
MTAELIREPALYIGGDWVAGGGSECEVENPATEETTGVVVQASPAEVDQAVGAARAAFDGWANTPVQDRVDALRRLCDVIADRAETFAALITREQGSPPPLARKLHVDTPLGVIARTADALEEFPFQWRRDNSVILREPVGVVAAITPWNLPLHQIIVKVVPALAAGCTVVLKPAALTPLTAFELARAFEAAGFPPGVFNLVTGGGRDVGDQLTRHPLVDHVSFTGSTAVGRQVAAAAADTVKGVTLELGGKSASVVLSDVSDELLAKAVKVTVANCFLNGGQTCTALSRLIVPTSRLAQVEELAAAAAAKYVPGERLGPLISAGQRKEVESFLVPGTAKAVTGAVPLPEKGHFVTPTVYSEVDPDSRLAQEEVFGPVLSILAAESDDHAIELANDSIYGLGGALWIEDKERALGWAARIRTGQIDVNAAPFNPRAPFGGYKQSGLGREIGDYGIDDVLEVKAVQL